LNGQRKVHMIGNAHIDPVWQWRWQEGFAEIKATFQSALDRIREFPDFIFTSACASYYKWIEENEPDMFEEIRTRIQEGRWSVAGGMWIQPDCNIPSGESFARHTLYSQRYFLDKFGKKATVGYNVDSFGHSGMLPQILKKSGIDYYVFHRPGDHEKNLPGNVFWWESQDGSRVLAFKIPFGYGSSGREALASRMTEIKDMAEDQGIDFMYFYGVGNHGGGPTITNIKNIHERQEQEDGEAFLFSSPEQYFTSLKGQTDKLPIIKDDLQHHASGCYSAHWEVKANNRKVEHGLINAEKLSTMAYGLLNYPYPKKEIQMAWEKVMFNQFHDIITGCSIKRAYDDARDWHGWAMYTTDWAQNGAVQKISWAIDTMKDGIQSLSKEKDGRLWENKDKGVPFVVFNPLSWEVNSYVQVNGLVKGVTDETGNPIQSQRVRGPQTDGEFKWNTIFKAKIPALGYRLYWVYLNKEFIVTEEEDLLQAGDNFIENEQIKLEIDKDTGHIKSLYDKKNGIETLKGAGSVPIVIDIEHCDTWAHNVFTFDDEVGRFGNAVVELKESGTLRSLIRVTSKYNQSTLRQDYIVHRDRSEVQVKVKLDWKEKHKMLKLAFPVNVSEPTAAYEIPYGFITRPTNGEEEPGQQWIDVTGKYGNSEYGLSLINSTKYSFSVLGNEMRMTIANSSIYNDHYGVRDEWCEFMDQGLQEFEYMLIPHAGSWQSVNAPRKAYEFNVKPITIMETYHKGDLPPVMEGIDISSESVIATVFKRAEEGNGYILRCYETMGKEETTNIYIPILNRHWNTSFSKCEIKTFFIPDTFEDEVIEVNFLEFDN
jgi:alpha-mannosidase